MRGDSDRRTQRLRRRPGGPGGAHTGVCVHSSAVIGSDVELGVGTEVGPFCRFEARVRTGERCSFGTGAVVGSAPMDRSYRGEDTEVVIGSANRFCEYVTINRATGEGGATVVGDGNFVMAYVHIGHNCRIGTGCTITNGVQLGGHVSVGDGANLGGLTGVHQHSRIGRLAMVGACSYVNKDIPAFVVAAGNPCRVRGLNVTGLIRAGVGQEAIRILRRAFRLVYRADLNLSQALDRIEAELLPGAGPGKGLEHLLGFVESIRSSKRGVELRSTDDASYGEA